MRNNPSSLLPSSHDVGKLFQRAATRYPEGLSYPEQERENLESLYLPGEHRSHYHVLYTMDFLEHHLSQKARDLYFLEGEEGNPIYIAAYHHKPRPHIPLDDVLGRVDAGAAEERSQPPEDAPGSSPRAFRGVRLESIFHHVSLFRRQAPKLWYRVAALSPDLAEAFPVDQSSGSPQDYAQVKDVLVRQWDNLMQEVVRLQPPFEVFCHWVQSLLEAFLWAVPADTQTARELSLYDHLRVVAALAQVYKRSPGKGMLVLGDLAGIQSFLYRLRSPAGGKGVAKILRGRSYFLTLLNEFLARWLCHRLGLAPPALLWASGGQFLLLAPAGSEQRLHALHREIEKALWMEFQGELGLALAWHTFSLDAIYKDFGQCLEEIRGQIQEAKGRRWASLLAQGLPGVAKEPIPHCVVCGTFAREGVGEEQDLCLHCRGFRELGGWVPIIRAIAFGEQDAPMGREASFVYQLRGLGAISLFEDAAAGATACFRGKQGVWFYTALNQPGSLYGSRFLAQAVPVYKNSEAVVRYLKERGKLEREGYEAGKIATTTVLAEASNGDARLGILRADVDHLGIVMVAGLPKLMQTPSRVASLSRMLDWFFAGRVHHLAQTMPQGTTNGLRAHLDGLLYIVYSGGDDLLALGPWDAALDFLLKVREEFRRYTGNCALDVSAGLVTCAGTFPIGRSAHLAGDAEKTAKDAGRGRLTLFGEALPWELAGQAVHAGKELADFVRRQSISRRLLFKLLETLGQSRKLSPLFWPNAYYVIAQTVPEGEVRQRVVAILRQLYNAPSSLNQASRRMQWAVLFTALSYACLSTQERR